MKHLKLSATIILSSGLLFACSGNSSTSAGNSTDSIAGSNTVSENSGDTSFMGNSSLAYTVSGRHVAIKDYFQGKDGKNHGALFINEVKNDPPGRLKITVTNELTQEVFNISVADAGSTAILKYSPSLSNFIDKSTNALTYMSPKYTNYYADSVIVQITNKDATHVTGIFSGRFISGDNKTVSLEITGGSFDVPFTKDKTN